MLKNDTVGNARSKRNSPAVNLTRFLAIRAGNSEISIAAIEGKDDVGVWNVWIKRCGFEGPLELLPCGNKAKVFKLREAIQRNKATTTDNVIFIVDRDYDDWAGNSKEDNTFVTDRYSIENYFICSNVIEHILNTKFGSAGNYEEKKNVLRSFERAFESYKAATWELHFNTYCLRRIDHATNVNLPAKFGSILEIKGPYQFEATDAHGVKIPCGTCGVELALLSSEFGKLSFLERARGKYHKLFFDYFFRALQGEKAVSNRNCFPVDKDESHFNYSKLSLSECAIFSDVPAGLSEFLGRNLFDSGRPDLVLSV